MKGGSATDSLDYGGFTIVEVMIFLAISGIMFISALNLMSGRQAKAEFSTGLDMFTSQLESAIGNVSDGYYTLPGEDGCTATGSGGAPVINSAGAGNNSPDCTFIGEVFSFGGSANGNQTYTAFPVIGLHYQSGTQTEATTLAQTQPTTSFSNPDLTITTTMPYGLTADYIKEPLSGSSYGAVGLFTFTSFSGTSADGALSSGSQHVELVPIPGSSLGQASSVTGSRIDNLTDACATTGDVCENPGGIDLTPINPSDGIGICVNSGTTSQSALLTIGGNNSPTEIATQLYSQQGCTDGS